MNQRIRKKRRAGEYAPAPLTAWQRIQAELTRQRVGEGYSEAHDDAHRDGALERAADAYALPLLLRGHLPDAHELPACWPWEARYWKPTPRNRDRELVKAGALYEAEIQRLTRIEAALHAKTAAMKPPVIISVYAIEASKLGRHFDRLQAKQALLETELNRRALHRRLPTGTSGPHQPGPKLATVLRALRGFGIPPGGWAAPWMLKLAEGQLQGGGSELVLAIWEYPHCYDFDARWQFDAQGQLTRYRATQASPKVPHPPSRLYLEGPSGRYLKGQPGWPP